MRQATPMISRREESPMFEPEHSASPQVIQSVTTVDDQLSESVLTQAPTAVTQDQSGTCRKRKMEEDSENDEGEFEDDGDEIVLAHDPDSEPLPNLPMYHPSVKEVESLSSQLISEFQYFISNSDYKDDEFDYLLEQSKVLEHPPHESHVLRIALIGDAGQGKSSLLNSMLGKENLAIYAADGNSCTYVVVEYAQASVTQTHPFQASIEFLSRQSCRDMVKEQLKNFWLHMTMDEDETDEEIANELRLGAGTCISLFSSLFLGQPEFHDRERAEDFLSNAESAADPRLMGKLMGWTDQILDEFMPNGDDNDVATLNANTASQISDAIQPFTMAMDDPQFVGTDLVCCPWPLVKKVRVSLYSRILEQGIIIADLPGTTDKVRSRVDNAKRYLQSCDMTIVVNTMARAIDHAALMNHINESFRRKRSGNTIVVGTRSDDVQVTSRQSFPPTLAEEKATAEIEEEEISIRKHIQDIGVALSSPQLKKNAFGKFQLNQKKERFVRQKNELARMRYQVRVLARNRHIKQGISGQYRQDTKDRSPLPVFCVSNVVYMQHLAGGYAKKDPPHLSLEATEIPALRTHLFSQPSLGKFASLEHYCRTSLPTFFNTVEISCSVSKLKRKDELNRTFHKSRGSLKETIDDVAENFTEHTFSLVYKIIDKNEIAWINQARRRCLSWTKFKPAGFTAVLRHNVDPAAALSGAIVAFRANIKERRAQISRTCESFQKTLKKEMRRLQVRATTDDDGHYFTETMSKVYASALAAPRIRGKRVHDVRSDALLRGVTAQDGPYKKIGHGIRKDYDAKFNTITDKLWTDLNGVFEHIRHDVSQVCSTKEDDSPEAIKMRQELLAMLPEARERLQRDIWSELAKCKEGRGRVKTEE